MLALGGAAEFVQFRHQLAALLPDLRCIAAVSGIRGVQAARKQGL